MESLCRFSGFFVLRAPHSRCSSSSTLSLMIPHATKISVFYLSSSYHMSHRQGISLKQKDFGTQISHSTSLISRVNIPLVFACLFYSVYLSFQNCYNTVSLFMFYISSIEIFFLGGKKLRSKCLDTKSVFRN